jgi:hypothetical protein
LNIIPKSVLLFKNLLLDVDLFLSRVLSCGE